VQHLALKYDGAHSSVETATLRPGPLELELDNQGRRPGAAVDPWSRADALHHLIGKRKPFVTAKRMLSNPDLPRSVQGRQSQFRPAG